MNGLGKLHHYVDRTPRKHKPYARRHRHGWQATEAERRNRRIAARSRARRAVVRAEAKLRRARKVASA